MKSLAVRVLVLAFGYALLGLAGMQVASNPGNVTAVWMPAGLSLAALFALGRNTWPGITLGSLACNLLVFPGDGPVAVKIAGATAIALVSTIGLVTTHDLIRKLAGPAPLGNPGALMRFMGCVAVGASINATGGLIITLLGGQVPSTLQFWLTWWVGDSVGMLAIAPAVLSEGTATPARPREWVGSVVLQLVAIQLVFAKPIAGLGGTTLPAAGVLLPGAVWAGARLGGRGVALQTVIVHTLVTWATISNVGPFSGHPRDTALLAVDALVVVLLLTGLMLVALAAELRAHQASLELRVKERTAELQLTNDQLVSETSAREKLGVQLLEAQKQEAIGRLAGGVAHDFNNLLTVIAGEAELLHRTQHDADVKDSAAAVLAAAQRAAELTRQLLAVARRQPSTPRAVDLREALLASRRLLRPVLPENLVLDVECEPGCTLLIDPVQLDQLVLNLALNARDAITLGGADTGAVRLSGSRRTLDDAGARELGLHAGAWLVLAVSDTGAGIAADVLPRIFEPFFTTKGAERGTGLGLSMVWGIASQAHGTVRVSSELGKGTTFEVWLPATDLVPDAVLPMVDAVPRLGLGRTILLAEDEPLVRSTIVRALEREGYRVVIATDGEEALALCRNAALTFDLLLTDVVMPRLGGVELARAVRAQRDVPVLFMSGFHERQAELEGERLLAKPFVPAQLTSAVAAALPGRTA